MPGWHRINQKLLRKVLLMKKTGVFYHDVCGKEAYSSLAMGVEDGFLGIKKEGLFNEPNVKWFESRQATEKEVRHA